MQARSRAAVFLRLNRPFTITSSAEAFILPMTIARKQQLPRKEPLPRREQLSLDGSLSTHKGFSLISNEKLLELYSTMLKCRMLENKIRALPALKAISPNGNSIAAIAAAVIDLRPEDTLAPSGSLLPCFVKGLPIAGILAAAAGQRASYASANTISPKFRTEIQLKRALDSVANRNKGKSKRIAVLFCSESPAGAGKIEHALLVAKRKKLPLVFVCHESGPATGPGLHGLPTVNVDENDAVAIYRVATEAISHARRGSGPTLIECKPWPLAGGKRSGKHRTTDPIRSMESYLAKKGIDAGTFKKRVAAAFKRELDEALRPASR
jgi:TPP-dependent pyruvate/acetoin dehydrogenase alpha subunit